MTVLAPPPPRLDALTSRRATVTDIHRQTHDVVTLDVEPGPGLGPFAAGQYDMVYAFGVGEAPISVSSDPVDAPSRSYTVRAVGAVTGALHELQPGATIGVRGPFGRPWPLDVAAGGDLVIVGGGIGLAPVRPAIVRAMAERDRYRRLVVVVGARTPRNLVFRDDLAAWRDDPQVELHVTVDSPARGWRGEVGLVTRALPDLDVDPVRVTLFTCGPEVMMRAVARDLVALGADPGRLFVTLERNMRCAVGTCGHCQLGAVFVCRDGPVFPWSRVSDLLSVPEL